MKKVIILLFLFICMILNAQQAKYKDPAQTTTEEYDFLTQDYNIENNFEVLEGYRILPIRVVSDDRILCDYQFLIKKGTGIVKAILIILKEKEKKHNKIDYLCIPINNEELMDRFIDEQLKIKLSKSTFLYEASLGILEDKLPNIFSFSTKEIETKQSEYTYLTEEFALNNKYNILEGYELLPLTSVILKENYEFNYQLLIESENQNVKALLVTSKKIKKDEEKVRYLCIPFNQDDLFNDYKLANFKLGVNMGYYHNLAVSIVATSILMEKYYYK